MGAEPADDGRAQPWWASADPTVDALADEDPVAAYRAAKRPSSEPSSDPSDPPPEDPPPGDPADAGREHGRLHDPAMCGRCPICLGLRRLGDQHPEVLEHLTEATRHISAAVRALLEQRPEPRSAGSGPRASSDGPAGSPRSAGTPFERIDVDGPDDPADPGASPS